MRPLDRVIAQHPVPTWRPLAYGIMALLVLLAVWSSQAELDTVAIAMGEVKPRGETKIVQHLEGGIIQDILVREGDQVVKGQPLIQLDVDASATNREELVVRLDGLQLKKLRLLAESRNEAPTFPEELAGRSQRLADAELQAYQSRLQNRDSELTVLERQEQQKRLEINELNVRRQAINNDLRLAQERYDTSLPLLDRKLITRMELLDLEREVERMKGELSAVQATLPRARAALEEFEERKANVLKNFQAEASNMLGDTELEIARTEKLVARADQEAGRLAISSPTDGVINVMHVNTIGGVVRSGEPILEIVPVQDKLIVEARVDPLDIGHIRTGMPATVKMTTYDFIRYGSLDGSVVTVGADIELDETTGLQYFPIVVETEKSALETADASYALFPGMQAQVDLHLGTKTVWDFLLQPVLKMRLEAFRER